MFTCIRYCKCIANVLWENKMHLNVCQYSVQKVSKGGSGTESSLWIQHLWFEWIYQTLLLLPRTFFPPLLWRKTFEILEAHSMFVYKASWMYILYIVDLPNLCSVSQMMLFLVVWDSAPSPPGWCLRRTFVCAVINVFTYVRFFFVCLSFQFPFLSSSVQN